MVDHWVPDLTHEINFWRFFWKLVKQYFKLKLPIFENAETNKDNSMPNYFKEDVTIKGIDLGHDVDSEVG